MTQVYSDPSRESLDTALPDVEVFYADRDFVNDWNKESRLYGEEGLDDTGWYYWYCFPGCLPDSNPDGPFSSEEEAIRAMRIESGYRE